VFGHPHLEWFVDLVAVRGSHRPNRAARTSKGCLSRRYRDLGGWTGRCFGIDSTSLAERWMRGPLQLVMRPSSGPDTATLHLVSELSRCAFGGCDQVERNWS
jgi:hypothetical protein